MSQGTARAVIGAYILASAWFKAHKMEPHADEMGVPECALLFANPGESIWACFFKRTRLNCATIFKCASCNDKTDRLNRAVEHQRAKWSHEPFACTDPLWCEAGTTVINCFTLADWTFYSGITLVSSAVPTRGSALITVVRGLVHPHVTSGAYLQYFLDRT